MKSKTSHPRPCLWLSLLLPFIKVACLTAQTAAPPSPQAADDQTVQLSPFVVQSENNSGYSSERTLSGTRSSADIIDLSTAVTVLNPQLISDSNAEDVQHLVG